VAALCKRHTKSSIAGPAAGFPAWQDLDAGVENVMHANSDETTLRAAFAPVTPRTATTGKMPPSTYQYQRVKK
jgi:hypothetical protein